MTACIVILLIGTALTIMVGLVANLMDKLLVAQIMVALGVLLEFFTLWLLIIAIINFYGGLK